MTLAFSLFFSLGKSTHGRPFFVEADSLADLFAPTRKGATPPNQRAVWSVS